MCSAMEQKILPTTPMLEIELINPYPHLEEFLQIAKCLLSKSTFNFTLNLTLFVLNPIILHLNLINPL